MGIEVIIKTKSENPVPIKNLKNLIIIIKNSNKIKNKEKVLKINTPLSPM